MSKKTTNGKAKAGAKTRAGAKSPTGRVSTSEAPPSPKGKAKAGAKTSAGVLAKQRVRVADFGVPAGGVPVTATERAAMGKPIAPDKPGAALLSPLSRPPRGTFPHQVAGMEFMLPFKPRPEQAKALEEVEAAFASGKRFVILEGPPGIGKSAIAMSLANHMGGAYICTLTKQLQQQYLKDYEAHGARELKGRAAFRCERAADTCDVGGTLFTGKDACGISETCPTCPYRQAKEEALSSWATICNYMSYLYNIGQGGEEEEGELAWQRPLLILDEGHEVESVLMDFVGVSISINRLPVLVPSDPPVTPSNERPDVDAYFKWLEVLLGRLKAEQKNLDPVKQVACRRLMLKILYLFKHRQAEEWIIEPWESEHGKGFEVKPLTVSSFGERMFKFGKRVLIMSATILDAEAVANSIGVPLHDYAFVRAPCIFPVENRPIYVGDLNMHKSARFSQDDPHGGSWPRMINAIASILSCQNTEDPRYNHVAQKGLLLAPSIEMLKYIQKELAEQAPQLAKRLILAYGKNRMTMYEQHLRERGPSVLAAAGFWEGVDLKGDASRFQIIPALPRPIWQGQVMERAKIDHRWYRWLYLCQLVQGVGRSVRSETDCAVTYVLDGELRREARGKRTMLPPWFLEAIQEIE